MEKFKEIVKKYGLESRADEIADYVMSSDKKCFHIKDFCVKFGLKEEDASHLLDVIYKAVSAREKFLSE